MPYYERQPYIMPVYQLLQEVIDGDIRVPRFQRSGTETTWKSEQRGDLLDSIYRAFPVGTILLWHTDEAIATLDKVGRFLIPKAKQAHQRLVLDGHQRLSTLVYILGAAFGEPHIEPGEEEAECWVFDVSEPKSETKTSRERFILLRPGEKPDDTQLPLSIALSRVKLNEWIRNHDQLTEASIQLVDGLRDKLREYNIPIAVLAADSLEDAAESFKRVNASGTPMSLFNMAAALAYTNEFDLIETIEEQKDELLAPLGWNDVDGKQLLQVVAGILRSQGDNAQHPLRLNVDKLAKTIRDNQSLLRDAVLAVADAAVAFRTIGIFGPKILPRSIQFTILSVFLNRYKQIETDVLSRWFWLTTYGHVFRSLNSSVYDRAYEALEQLSKGHGPDAMEKYISGEVKPLGKSDFRAVRTKAYLLAMAYVQVKGRLSGAAHKALAKDGAEALEVLVSGGKRSNWHQLAILTPDLSLKEVRDMLARFEEHETSLEEDDILGALGIDRSWGGKSVDDILTYRRELIEQREQEIVDSLGLSWVS